MNWGRDELAPLKDPLPFQREDFEESRRERLTEKFQKT